MDKSSSSLRLLYWVLFFLVLLFIIGGISAAAYLAHQNVVSAVLIFFVTMLISLRVIYHLGRFSTWLSSRSETFSDEILSSTEEFNRSDFNEYVEANS